jgi:hypothetical protein
VAHRHPPEDVILALPRDLDAAPARATCWPASIARITHHGGGVRVVVDCGFPLVARVTPAPRRAGPGRGHADRRDFQGDAPHVIPTVDGLKLRRRPVA